MAECEKCQEYRELAEAYMKQRDKEIEVNQGWSDFVEMCQGYGFESHPRGIYGWIEEILKADS